jgi:uncharacterized membrane protein YsdA (DUF1294 family)
MSNPRPGTPRGVGLATFIALGVLLALPVYALARLASSIDPRLLVGVPLALSIVAFLACRSDKRRAEAGQWRIPETTLHLLALLGGWPGAFLAQRAYRHKTAKPSFQVVFWLIVLVHQFVAVDSLLGWRMARDVLDLLRT